MRRWSRVYALAFILAFVACTAAQRPADVSVAPAGVWDIPLETVNTDDRSPASEVVASVDGRPIFSSDVSAHVSGSQLTSARDVLSRLIEMEVMAVEAEALGLLESVDIVRAHKMALVQTYLDEQFEASHAPTDIGLEHVERIYRIPRIRSQYDHADKWGMAHVFFSCCDPKLESCVTDEILECFSIAGDLIQTVYAELKEEVKGVEGDPKAVAKIAESYRRSVEERFPQLAYRERGFYYDPHKTHDAQKGYTVIAETVARGIIEAPPGVLVEPVLSPFGWHILIKLDHVSERRLGPSDPTVIADIRKHAFPKYLESRFQNEMSRLRNRYMVTIDPEPLEALGGPQ